MGFSGQHPALTSIYDAFSDDQKAVFIRRYGQAKTEEVICAELGLSRARYTELVESCLRAMRRARPEMLHSVLA